MTTGNYLIHWYTYTKKEHNIFLDEENNFVNSPTVTEESWEQHFERLWDVTENQVIKFVNSQKKLGVEKIWYEII